MRGDHVVQAVAVYVVDAHFRAAAAEVRPDETSRVLPASPLGGCSHHPRGPTTSMRPSPLISPTPMPCAFTPVFSEIWWTIHGAVGLAGSGLAYSIAPSAAEQHFGLSVAVDVLQQLDLGGSLRDDVVAIPAARLALRIDVQIDRPLIHHQNVRPAVAGEIVREIHHALGELVAGIVGAGRGELAVARCSPDPDNRMARRSRPERHRD